MHAYSIPPAKAQCGCLRLRFDGSALQSRRQRGFKLPLTIKFQLQIGRPKTDYAVFGCSNLISEDKKHSKELDEKCTRIRISASHPIRKWKICVLFLYAARLLLNIPGGPYFQETAAKFHTDGSPKKTSKGP